MEEVSIIGIDLAKRSFQVHGAKADGSVAYRRKLSRGKLLSFLASQRPCTVAMEACASAHYWGREIVALGHEVRVVPPTANRYSRSPENLVFLVSNHRADPWVRSPGSRLFDSMLALLAGVLAHDVRRSASAIASRGSQPVEVRSSRS